MIVTPDSGVWLSAIRFGGVPGKALYVAATAHQLAISDLIEEEVLRNMSRKFHFSVQQAQRLMGEFLAEAIRITITHEIKGVCRDPKDDHVLECAKKAHAHFIISGDGDLLCLKEFEGIKIVTPRQFLEGNEL